MRKLVLWIALGAVVGATASAASPPCREPKQVNIEVGPASFAYADKQANPVPEIETDCPFIITTTWLEGAKPGQSITLSDFLAASDVADRGKWTTVLSVAVRDEVGDEVDPTFQYSTEAQSKKFVIPTTWNGPPRLILFTLTLVTDKRATVTFDPPWSEKR